MKLKEMKKSKLPFSIKKFLRIVCKKIFNKKVKIFFLCLIVIISLLVGTFFGMMITKFFGTLSSPSQLALDFAHEMNLNNLRENKIRIEGILAENIKIPINYIKISRKLTT